MAKYRLLKDLPGYKAGTVFAGNGQAGGEFYQASNGNDYVYIDYMLKNPDPDWFEEVKEPTYKIAEPMDGHIVVELLLPNYRKADLAIFEAIKALLDYVHMGDFDKEVYRNFDNKVEAARKAVGNQK